MVKSRILLGFTLLISLVIFPYFIIGFYNYNVYSKYSDKNSTKESSLQLILNKVKQKDLTELKYIHCGWDYQETRQNLDKLLDVWWNRVKDYDWSDAVVRSNPDNIYLVIDNISTKDGLIVSEKFEITSRAIGYLMVYDSMKINCFTPEKYN